MIHSEKEPEEPEDEPKEPEDEPKHGWKLSDSEGEEVERPTAAAPSGHLPQLTLPNLRQAAAVHVR